MLCKKRKLSFDEMTPMENQKCVNSLNTCETLPSKPSSIGDVTPMKDHESVKSSDNVVPEMNTDQDARDIPTSNQISPCESPLAKRRRRMSDRAAKESPHKTLTKQVSDSEILAKKALEQSEENKDLVGDYSKPCSLSTIQGQKRDLSTITAATLVKVLSKEKNVDIKVIDCRYPYEYEGGHISTAKNLYTQQMIRDEFLAGKEPLNSPTSNKNNPNIPL